MKKFTAALLITSMLFSQNAFAAETAEIPEKNTAEQTENIQNSLPDCKEANGDKYWNGIKITWEKPKNCPVLTYHHFILNPKWASSWTTTPDKFEKDIKSLLDNGYTFITTDQWIDGQKEDGVLPEKPVILHFDDGYT